MKDFTVEQVRWIRDSVEVEIERVTGTRVHIKLYQVIEMLRRSETLTEAADGVIDDHVGVTPR